MAQRKSVCLKIGFFSDFSWFSSSHKGQPPRREDAWEMCSAKHQLEPKLKNKQLHGQLQASRTTGGDAVSRGGGQIPWEKRYSEMIHPGNGLQHSPRGMYHQNPVKQACMAIHRRAKAGRRTCAESQSYAHQHHSCTVLSLFRFTTPFWEADFKCESEFLCLCNLGLLFSGNHGGPNPWAAGPPLDSPLTSFCVQIVQQERFDSVPQIARIFAKKRWTIFVCKLLTPKNIFCTKRVCPLASFVSNRCHWNFLEIVQNSHLKIAVFADCLLRHSFVPTRKRSTVCSSVQEKRNNFWLWFIALAIRATKRKQVRTRLRLPTSFLWGVGRTGSGGVVTALVFGVCAKTRTHSSLLFTTSMLTETKFW